jgi:hypothetical protein
MGIFGIHLDGSVTRLRKRAPLPDASFRGGEMNTSRKSDKSDTKKHYESPKLVIYGDIWALTQNRGSSGKVDHGGFPANKTA